MRTVLNMAALRLIILPFFYVLLSCLAGSSPSIEMLPPAFLPGVTQSVQITCRSPAAQNISYVVSLQLYRDSPRQSVASYVTSASPALEALGVALKASVSGSYDAGHPGQAFLNVSVPQPSDSAAGDYICVVDTLDSTGLLHNYFSQASLVSLAKNGSVPAFYNSLLRELRVDLDTLTSDLNRVHTSQTDISSADSKAQNQLSAIDNDASKIRSMTNDVSSLLLSANDKVTSMESALLQLRDITPESPVSFYAYISGHYSTPAIEGNVVFNVLDPTTNDNAYSRSNGIFTVPQNGTYFFRTSVLADYVYSVASILVNGDPVASLVANDDYVVHQATACVVVEVMVGDEVKVVKKKGSNFFGYYPNSSYTHLSYFMGMLLW